MCFALFLCPTHPADVTRGARRMTIFVWAVVRLHVFGAPSAFPFFLHLRPPLVQFGGTSCSTPSFSSNSRAIGPHSPLPKPRKPFALISLQVVCTYKEPRTGSWLSVRASLCLQTSLCWPPTRGKPFQYLHSQQAGEPFGAFVRSRGILISSVNGRSDCAMCARANHLAKGITPPVSLC